jgi:Flp pilus assembly protein TadG
MMRRLSLLRRDRRGSTAAEFALTLPIWAMLVMSLFNMARVYHGRAGVLHGLGEAARTATLWPHRSNADMTTAFNNRVFGLVPGEAPALSYATGTVGGQQYVDITVTYTPVINLFLINVEPFTLTFQRRAFRPS